MDAKELDRAIEQYCDVFHSLYTNEKTFFTSIKITSCPFTISWLPSSLDQQKVVLLWYWKNRYIHNMMKCIMKTCTNVTQKCQCHNNIHRWNAFSRYTRMLPEIDNDTTLLFFLVFLIHIITSMFYHLLSVICCSMS